VNEVNQLGELSLGTFYTRQGMQVLNNIVNSEPALLNYIRLQDESGRQLTLEHFFESISDARIR